MEQYEYDAVIIDTGISKGINKKQGINIGQMYYEPYTDSLYEEDLTDVIGHGTAVCNAMLKHMERGKILMIRVYSKLAENFHCLCFL